MLRPSFSLSSGYSQGTFHGRTEILRRKDHKHLHGGKTFLSSLFLLHTLYESLIVVRKDIEDWSFYRLRGVKNNEIFSFGDQAEPIIGLLVIVHNLDGNGSILIVTTCGELLSNGHIDLTTCTYIRLASWLNGRTNAKYSILDSLK